MVGETVDVVQLRLDGGGEDEGIETLAERHELSYQRRIGVGTSRDSVKRCARLVVAATQTRADAFLLDQLH